jgi:hypothetical protein
MVKIKPYSFLDPDNEYEPWMAHYDAGEWHPELAVHVFGYDWIFDSFPGNQLLSFMPSLAEAANLAWDLYHAHVTVDPNCGWCTLFSFRPVYPRWNSQRGETRVRIPPPLNPGPYPWPMAIWWGFIGDGHYPSPP